MTEAEKQHSGQIYDPGDGDIVRDQIQCQELLYDYNQTRPSEGDKRQALLSKMFASIGEGCYIEPPLHANWGGHFVKFGERIYANYGLTLVDDTYIEVGSYTEFGPNVVLATAGHPILPGLRLKGLQYNLPVKIGNNCWLGAGVIVLPGITIGDNTVVGAGSVVTHDLPANVVAVGNPCRILREIGPADREFYRKGMPIPAELLDD